MLDQYIKMVLTLPEEFFKGWEYKDGDFIIIFPHRYKEYLGEYNVSGIYLCFNNLLCRKENEHTNHWIPARWVKFEDGRPLPSQEQLLQIYTERKGLQYSSLALLWLANWIEDKVTDDHGFCFEYESAEAIALLWVQETCFDKTWDGTKWIKNI